MIDYDVAIIGGGISGLTAATYLSKTDIKFALFEAENEIGGRVRTDTVDGFKLDRGFQVFLPSYPEAKKILSYEELDLQYFQNGAFIINKDKKYYLLDPESNPKEIFKAVFDANISLKDKLKLFQFKNRLKSKSLESIFADKEIATNQKLLESNFSLQLIKDFFQPFLSGIFFEKELNTSSRMFEFVIKMFNDGGAAVPANGMSEIPKQLESNLPQGVIHKNSKIKSIKDGEIEFENGDKLKAGKIILAIEGNSHLLKGTTKNDSFVSSTCFYFSCDKPAINEPLLVLNGDEKSCINNLCFMTNVSENYSEYPHKCLLSVSSLESDVSEEQIKNELKRLFGDQVEEYKFIKRYDIQYSLPEQNKVSSKLSVSDIKINENLYLAGDHNRYGSLNAAMQSGREAAELVIKDMS